MNLNTSSGSRHFKKALGWFPTAKNDRAEMEVYKKVHARSMEWLKKEYIHSGNVKDYFHDMHVFSQLEAEALYDYASSIKDLEKLLPTKEACNTYVMSVILALISEEHASKEIPFPQAQPQQQPQQRFIPRPNAMTSTSMQGTQRFAAQYNEVPPLRDQRLPINPQKKYHAQNQPQNYGLSQLPQSLGQQYGQFRNKRAREDDYNRPAPVQEQWADETNGAEEQEV